MQLLQSSNYFVFYPVYMYCTVISVIVYHRSLLRFCANKRVQSLISFLPCRKQYFSTRTLLVIDCTDNFFWVVCSAVDLGLR